MCRHSPALFLWQEISAYLDVCRGGRFSYLALHPGFPNRLDRLSSREHRRNCRKKENHPTPGNSLWQTFLCLYFCYVLFGLSHFVLRENNWTPFSVVVGDLTLGSLLALSALQPASGSAGAPECASGRVTEKFGFVCPHRFTCL